MALHGGMKNKDGKLIKETITNGKPGPDGKTMTNANPAYKVVDPHGKTEIVRK